MRSIRRELVASSLVLVAGVAAAEQIRVLDSHRLIARFDTVTGELSDAHSVTGLVTGERVRAADTGPLGILYGLTGDRLYMIDALSGAATPVGPRFVPPVAPASPTERFAFDFHPTVGVARVLIGLHAPGAGPPVGTRSLTVDPVTCEVTEVDPQTHAEHVLSYAAGDPGEGQAPLVTSAAYHPAVTDTPTLYGIDTARGTLVRIGPAGAAGFAAEDDVVTTIAPLSGLADGATVQSLEATTDGALLLLASDAVDLMESHLYAVDIDTGALSALPDVRTPFLVDLTSAPSVALGPAAPLDTTSARVMVHFRLRNRDQVRITGRIDLPVGGWAGKQLRVDVGGIVREFSMDGRGRGVSGRDSFRITGKPHDGTWRYVLEIHGDRFGGTLGMSDDQTLGVVTPVIDVFVGDLLTGQNVYRTELTLGYSVRRGRGVARQ